jgi:hypothetical protein
MNDPMSDADLAVADALKQLLEAPDVAAVGAKLAKQKDLKAAFAPIAKSLAWAPIERIVQTCLEQSGDHPLHLAARSLVTDGTIAWRVFAPVATAQPKREVRRLALSTRTPHVFAFEARPVISVWSLETGAHVEDLKLVGSKNAFVLDHGEAADGTLRVLTSEGLVLERKPAANVLTKVKDLGKVHHGCATSSDLSSILVASGGEPAVKDDGDWISLQLHRLPGKQTEIEVPLSWANSTFATVDDRTIVLL